MSSKKKQLRSEAAKAEKQLRRYTLTFWVVIAVVLAIFVGAVAMNPVKNMIYKNSDAIQVGNHTVSAVEANYFYMDAVNNYTSQYGDYLEYILDTSKPLNEQVSNDETGETWADGFFNNAKDTMKRAYALYDEAMANNFKLSEADQKSIDTMMNTLEIYAPLYGYKNVDSYLRAVYGPGSTAKSYLNYYTLCATADAYVLEHSDSLKYEASDLREFEAGSAFKYNSYTYASYFVTSASFYQGGTKDEKGNVTYSAEEKKAGAAAAEKVANGLAETKYATVADFDAAIKALEINKDKTDVASVKYDEVLYKAVNSTFRDWIAGKVEPAKEGDEPTYVDRKEGDITVVASKSGTGDNEIINGYYVVRFESISDNVFALKNVRHLLISFEGGKTDENTGITTYTDEEKAAAQSKAAALLTEWESGAKTEDSFAELAKEHSTDPGSKSNGGLYEDIYPGQMVEPFDAWCFDANRQVGDTGLVETDYGFHVMFFVGDSETNYRDYMVTNDLRSSDMDQWTSSLVEKVELNVLSDKYIRLDYVLGGHDH